MQKRVHPAAAVLAACTVLVLAPQAAAAPVPQPAAVTAESKAAAARAAAAPDTLATLSRFFAREGKVTLDAARPRIEGEAVPVNHLSPDFVAGRAGAGVARLEFLASKAVSSDGQQAALWTARTAAGWQVVNIATGDDEFRYAQLGAAKLPGGTVFREPQIDAWYVAAGDRVLPLDEDAERAVGTGGVTLAVYRARVVKAYGDKLPGSAYARKGEAGGYAEAAAEAGGGAGTGAGTSAGAPVAAGGVAGGLALAAAAVFAVRRSRRGRSPA
ncbi:hypothetical protein [Streptomyces sp. NRRL F-2747]|uniref:hypothetical protein n=1 Tax=Streptomyces sp. NRRL F-2747 TaxID=1463843 RepID=UPI00068F11AC|nr:hypothetical protein [Streptomyces sp. NRRL F-2747]